jgi:hypothetical protein
LIVSGWLGVASVGDDELVERWTAEVDGSDVLAAMAISAYTQGFADSYASFASSNISGYSNGHGLVNLGRDPRNNAYFIRQCETVQFDLWGRFVRAFAHAATFPVNSAGRFPRLEHVHRRYAIAIDGKVIGRHRVSLLAHESKLDAAEVLSNGLGDIAARHGVAAGELNVDEIDDRPETVHPFMTP